MGGLARRGPRSTILSRNPTFLMKSWSFYPIFIKKWFWRAFPVFVPKVPPKTPKKPQATEAFAPRDHGKQKRGQMCANGVILPHFHTFALIFSLFCFKWYFWGPGAERLIKAMPFQVFWECHWGKTPENPPQNHFLLKRSVILQIFH